MRLTRIAVIALLGIVLVSTIACGSSSTHSQTPTLTPTPTPTVSSTAHLTTGVMQGQGEVYPSSGDYPMGTQVTITAVPADGWVFAGWGNCMEEEWPDNTYTITLQWEASIVEACFIEK